MKTRVHCGRSLISASDGVSIPRYACDITSSRTPQVAFSSNTPLCGDDLWKDGAPVWDSLALKFGHSEVIRVDL
jgi:hypothetical protein